MDAELISKLLGFGVFFPVSILTLHDGIKNHPNTDTLTVC